MGGVFLDATGGLPFSNYPCIANGESAEVRYALYSLFSIAIALGAWCAGIWVYSKDFGAVPALLTLLAGFAALAGLTFRSFAVATTAVFSLGIISSLIYQAKLHESRRLHPNPTLFFVLILCAIGAGGVVLTYLVRRWAVTRRKPRQSPAPQAPIPQWQPPEDVR